MLLLVSLHIKPSPSLRWHVPPDVGAIARKQELSYVVARAVSHLVADHEASRRAARKLGAVEMLTKLMETQRATAGAAGLRSVLTALAALCADAPSSQRVFRRVIACSLPMAESRSASLARRMTDVMYRRNTNALRTNDNE